MNGLIVIHEKDHDDNDKIVIGVADSVENAEKIIEKYYGEYELISFHDIRDSGLEYSKVLRLKGAHGKSYKVTVTLEWFILNECI